VWKTFDFLHTFGRKICQRQRHRSMHEAMPTVSFGNTKANKGVNGFDGFKIKSCAKLRPRRSWSYAAPGYRLILEIENPTVVRTSIPELSAQTQILCFTTILPSIPTRGFPGHTPTPTVRRRNQ
jgi:hypothetical protein